MLEGNGKSQLLMMRYASFILTIALVAVQVAGADCTCRHPEKGDTTRWGGNMLVVQVAEKHYRDLVGTVSIGEGSPVKDALVEVFDNADYLLDGATASHPPKQKRLRACITGADGKFCVRNLPSGKYELRASVNAGIDVTHIYVVDRKRGSNEPMVVRLRVGT